MVLAVAERAVSTSVKPAAASFAEFSSIVPSISVDTPADSAEYADSASPSAASPVDDESSRIVLLSSLNCSSVPLKRVFVLAMEDSKLMPELSASLPKLMTASVALVIRLPANTPSAFLATSPRELVLFWSPSVLRDVSKVKVPSDAIV